jgi:hypothetical protein
VIDYFNRVYDLALNAQDRADMAAYLTAVGNGVRPEYHLTGTNVLDDINGFASVLDIAISSHDTQVVAFTVRSVNALLQDLAERYPDPKDHENSGGAHERALARATIAALTQTLHRADGAASSRTLVVVYSDTSRHACRHPVTGWGVRHAVRTITDIKPSRN